MATQHHDCRVREIALALLDTIETFFGRVAYRIPDAMPQGDPLPVMAHVGKISKEFAEAIDAAADALADGRLDSTEVALMKKDLSDLTVCCIKFQAMLDHPPVAQRLRRVMP